MALNPKMALSVGALALLFSTGLLSASSVATNQTLLNSAYQFAQCKTNFTVTFINDIVNSAPKLSGLGQYSTTLQQQTSQLGVLANQGNVDAFRTYVSGTYDPELRIISSNVSAQVKAANLSANVLSVLRLGYSAAKVLYVSCTNTTARSFAEKKLALFNSSMAEYQGQMANLDSRGVNTANLSVLLVNAQSQIITPFQTGIQQATTNAQIYAILAKYCLFDGCKNGTNFHLEAKFELGSLTAGLAYLQSNPNITATGPLAQAQADLNAAGSLLTSVGILAYTPGQANQIFGDLRNASKLMQSVQVESSASKLIAKEQQAINTYQAKITALAENGINTTGLSQWLAQANSVVAQQQAALNGGYNASQLKGIFDGSCIDNSCRNGTNMHLTLNLELGSLNAALQRAISEVEASRSLVLNQSGVATEQGYLNSAASLIASWGTAQYSQSQLSQIQGYFASFNANRKLIANRNTSSSARPNAVTTVHPNAVTTTVGPTAVNHGGVPPNASNTISTSNDKTTATTTVSQNPPPINVPVTANNPK